MLAMPNFLSRVETVTAVHTLLGTPNYYPPVVVRLTMLGMANF